MPFDCSSSRSLLFYYLYHEFKVQRVNLFRGTLASRDLPIFLQFVLLIIKFFYKYLIIGLAMLANYILNAKKPAPGKDIKIFEKNGNVYV